jgi:hypothetical protein
MPEIELSDVEQHEFDDELTDESLDRDGPLMRWTCLSTAHD